MNLQTLFSHLPHETLQQLAGEFGITTYSPSKRNLIIDITARYRDFDFIAELVDELSEESRGLLFSLVLFTNGNSETIEIPSQLNKAWCSRVPMETLLSEVLNKGLLFRNQFGDESGLLLPADIRRTLLDVFKNRSQTAVPSDSSTPLLQTHEVGIESIFHLLSILNHTRGKRTQHGTLHRKIFELWKQRFSLYSPEERFFELSFDFACQYGLIESDRELFRPTHKAMEWFQRSQQDRHRDLWNYILHHHLLSDSCFQLLIMQLWSIHDEAEHAHTPRTYRIDSILDTFSSPQVSYPVRDLQPKERMNHYLFLLQFAGIVDCDSLLSPTVFSISPPGKYLLFHENGVSKGEQASGEVCTLQGNFEILIPPSADYSILWKLDQLAEFRHRDIMTKYCFTRQSITHAMRLGWTTDQVFSFIESLTDNRIPEIVRFSLEEWCNRYGLITIRRTTVIECATRELADEISHIPDIQDLYEERISERHFLVSETHAKKMFRLLQTHGYEPAHFRKEKS